jgi:hypothetical protein
LADLAGVGAHESQPSLEPCGQHEVLPDQAAEDRLGVGDDAVQVEHLGLQYLLAAEGEQLARQRGGLIRRLPDRIEPRPSRIALVGAADEHLRVAADDREQVVEVVGDAAG